MVVILIYHKRDIAEKLIVKQRIKLFCRQERGLLRESMVGWYTWQFTFLCTLIWKSLWNWWCQSLYLSAFCTIPVM